MKDDGQTQDTSYTVKHTIEGVEQTDDTRIYKGTAWINETNPTIEVKAGTLTPNEYTATRLKR